jgi:hypothetical protein
MLARFTVVGRSFDAGRAVVLRDRAADDHARVQGETGEGRFEDRAADIVEVDVDAGLAMLGQGAPHILALVIDASVETERVDHGTALGLAARDTDRTTVLDLRDLADDRADGPGRSRLSRNRPTNSISASPGSQPLTASRRGATSAHAGGRHARAAAPPAHASNRTRAENRTRGELQPPHFPVCLVASSRDTLPQQAPRGVGFPILHGTVFVLMILGDDRAVFATYIMGRREPATSPVCANFVPSADRASFD